MSLITKSIDGGRVNGDTVRKGSLKLIRHDGYVFLFSENVAESQTDKLNVLFLNILYNFLLGIFHSLPPLSR